MIINNAILIGAGCPLANALAIDLGRKMNVIGVAKHDFSNTSYHRKIVTDFLSEDSAKRDLSKIVSGLDSLVVITCTGRFPVRKSLSDYTKDDDLRIFESNVLGFLVPFRATIEQARNATVSAYVTFGSVAQAYNYPQLGLFTAAKDALRSIVKTASHEEAKYGVRFYHLNLSTLDQENEDCFTSSSAGEFLPCEEVAKNISNLLDGVENAPYLTEVQIYRYSDAYYAEGYFSRIPNTR
jgi:NAD(P)-dependent dehydrogenase (short-subunit alcohol dehydrogenase family)